MKSTYVLNDRHVENLTIRKKESSPATVYVTLRGPPLDSEMGWTGELWSKTKFLILEN